MLAELFQKFLETWIGIGADVSLDSMGKLQRNDEISHNPLLPWQ
jgi:hypothetical protein